MRLIARILSVSLFCLTIFSGGLELWAAEPNKSLEELASLMKKLPGHRVEADYSFKLMQGKTAICCSGHAIIQENLFRISGNGMEIFCNGKTITYLDPERKEAYIEDAVKLDEYVKANITSIRELTTGRVAVSAISDNHSEFDAPALDGDWVVTDLR